MGKYLNIRIQRLKTLLQMNGSLRSNKCALSVIILVLFKAWLHNISSRVRNCSFIVIYGDAKQFHFNFEADCNCSYIFSLNSFDCCDDLLGNIIFRNINIIFIGKIYIYFNSTAL